MKTRIGNPIGRLALAVLMSVLAVVGPPDSPNTPTSTAEAATGDLLKTVNFPAAAQCGTGTSAGVVSGRMVGRVDIPVMLVVSCNAKSELYFLDPSVASAANGFTAGLVKTITTTGTPPAGWNAISGRSDRGDLLGCGNTTGGKQGIYSIDINPSNSTADGTAVQLFTTSLGSGDCDGLAWDAGDKTVFVSPNASPAIYHFTAAGIPVGTGSFASPPACPTTGLAVAGASLFVACGSSQKIYQVDKTTGLPATFGPTGKFINKSVFDLECDPQSFASGTSPKDALWARDPSTNQVYALEIPLGTCGGASGVPVVPARCVGNIPGTTKPYPPDDSTDTDGDGLLDCWEANGIDFNGDGVIDFLIPGADRLQKDLYLEIDYMSDRVPSAAALDQVKAAFGAKSITLHSELGDSIPTNANLAFEPCTPAASTGPAGTPDFDSIKRTYFGTAGDRASPNAVNILNARRFVYHYGLNVNNLLGRGTTSGCAEVWGNDLVVSLGGWPTPGGTVDEQAATWMHELVHNLDRRHGGHDNVNCKPNYQSIMNYAFQFRNWLYSRPLDLSDRVLAPLDEVAGLDEPTGLNGSGNARVGSSTVTGQPAVRIVSGDGSINWNADRDARDAGVTGRDINNLGADSGCDGAGTRLEGSDDWTNLKFNFRLSPDFADGRHASAAEAKELTKEQVYDAPSVRLVQYQKGGTCQGLPSHAILQPINSDGSSAFKQGSTVPVKFRICDAAGVAIGDQVAGVVASFNLVSKRPVSITDVNEEVVSTTPDTEFRWSAADRQWIFNLSTRNLAANTEYRYRIVLFGGSVIEFSFRLK